MVEAAGFEPATTDLQNRCSPGLSYAPAELLCRGVVRWHLVFCRVPFTLVVHKKFDIAAVFPAIDMDGRASQREVLGYQDSFAPIALRMRVVAPEPATMWAVSTQENERPRLATPPRHFAVASGVLLHFLLAAFPNQDVIARLALVLIIPLFVQPHVCRILVARTANLTKRKGV